jgi:hypothetical protein
MQVVGQHVAGISVVAAEVLNRSNISIIQDGSWKAVLVTRLTNVMPEAHGYPPLIEAIRELEKTRNAVAECAGYSLGHQAAPIAGASQ